MAGLERVKPGDLITSALLNAIIDAVASVESKVALCKQRLDELPTRLSPERPDEETTPPGGTPTDEGGRRPAMLVERIVPFDASPKDVVTIAGRGFPTDVKVASVSIGGKAATVKTATAAAIDVEVPTLGFKKRAEVVVIVGDPNGAHATGRMTVGPPAQEVKTGVALLSVKPEGKLNVDTKYELGFIVGSTGRDNVKVTVASVDPKTRKRVPLVARELSFALQKTQKLEVAAVLPKQGATIEVSMTKKDEVVASQSYAFVVGQDPPIDTSEDVFGLERKR